MEAIKLQRKYPTLDQSQVRALVEQFYTLDSEQKHELTQQTVLATLTAPEASNDPSKQHGYDSVRLAIKQLQLDSAGKLELDDYIHLIAILNEPQIKLPTSLVANLTINPKPQSSPGKGKVLVQGSTATHTINEDERTEFTRHINSVLAGDLDIGDRLPIPMDTMQIFDECRDGLLLSKLINDAVPDTIDERVLNKAKTKPRASPGSNAPLAPPKPMNAFQQTENNNLVISSAASLGLSTVNVGAADLGAGAEILILGLIWQIIRRGLLSKISIKLHPELFRLLLDGETLEEFLRLREDEILRRWVNYHLAAAGEKRRVNNFSGDVKDAECYIVLLNQLKPDLCTRDALRTTNLLDRAEQLLQSADRLDCRKYLTPSSLVAGNAKLHLAFVANLFNTHPCLAPYTAAAPPPMIEEFDAEGEREARVFTLWLNSLEVTPGVRTLLDDLRDGLVLLQAFDKILPGAVIWKRVAKPRVGGGELGARVEMPEEGQGYGEEDGEGESKKPEMSRFKMVENCNYSIELARREGLHMVGIQGADLVDANPTLTLGLVWQLMRLSISRTLSSLAAHGKPLTDADMVRWANTTVALSTGAPASPRAKAIRGFGDKSLGDGIFFLELLDGLKKGYVDWGLVEMGKDEKSCKANAKLAISIARKLGSLIFIVAEDIVDVRPRLILTFVAALMSLQSTLGAQ